MMQRAFFQPVRPWLRARFVLCGGLLCWSFASLPSQADTTPSSTPKSQTPNNAVGPIFPDGGNIASGYRNLWGHDRAPYYLYDYWRRYQRYYVQADWYQATPWYNGANLFNPAPSRPRTGTATTTRQIAIGHPLLRGLALDVDTQNQARRMIAEHNRAETQAKQTRQQAIRDIWALAKAARAMGDTEDYQNQLQTLRELSTKQIVTPELIESLRSIIPEQQQPVFERNVGHAIGNQTQAEATRSPDQTGSVPETSTAPQPSTPASPAAETE